MVLYPEGVVYKGGQMVIKRALGGLVIVLMGGVI